MSDAERAGEPSQAPDFWPGCGYRLLERNDAGALVPTPAWWARFLDGPELALVPESCAAEIALHRSLRSAPTRPVAVAEWQTLADPDARENYRLFLAFRDGLLAAGSVQACYLALFRRGSIDIPPTFVDALTEVIVRHLLDGCDQALLARAGEMLFRPQRISTQDGQVLAGDRETLDRWRETGGLGELGRLLTQAQVPLRRAPLAVLGPESEANYWAPGARHRHLLDLRHELGQDLGHGLHFRLKNARSGLQALARVLERWVDHLLGVPVAIEPLPRVEDARWRWHVGLDAQSTALLNDLYRGEPVSAEREQRLISLFRLTFAQPQDMRADVRGMPVYLGLAMNEDQVLRIKPQNLLLNLPLAAGS